MFPASSSNETVVRPLVEISASTASRSSISLRSVISNVMPRMPTGVPFSSLMVDDRASAQIVRPSV